MKVIGTNKKAYHEYHVLDTVEAGICLKGTEIKSIRAARVNFKDSYARCERDEMFLHGLHISPYEQGNRYNVDPERIRKLLLHRAEISKLVGKTAERGMTLVPLKIYLKNNRAKVELGLVKGKKLHDKREAIANRDRDRLARAETKERMR